jgi:GTP cyclohydrolase IA
VNEKLAAESVRNLLIALGYDPDHEALIDTPKRVAKAMREATDGRDLRAEDVLGTTFPADGYDEVILLRNIPFYSMCEHHLLPFHGHAHVAYVPAQGEQKRVVGLSKLARLVDMHARRLQLQERMTANIADDLERVLAATGVGVIVTAKHLCMCSRGVAKDGASMVTSVMRGCFMTKPEARAELMELIRP